MQKLLIVLAIQFCLPLLAYGLEQLAPLSGWWWSSLDALTVFINTVCVGCMLGLMWPRWRWMLLTSGLLIGYLVIWQAVYFSEWRDYALDLHNELRWLQIKFWLKSAAVSAVLGGLLSPWLQLDFKSGPSRTNFFRFTLGDLLWMTLLLAVLVISASLPFSETELLHNFLGFFGHVDAVWLISAWAIFYLLLWPSLSCKLVAIVVCAVAVFILAMLPYQELPFLNSGRLDYVISRSSFLYLALLTVILYRALGLRLLRRPTRQTSAAPVREEVASCKNC